MSNLQTIRPNIFWLYNFTHELFCYSGTFGQAVLWASKPSLPDRAIKKRGNCCSLSLSDRHWHSSDEDVCLTSKYWGKNLSIYYVLNDFLNYSGSNILMTCFGWLVSGTILEQLHSIFEGTPEVLYYVYIKPSNCLIGLLLESLYKNE